MQRDLESLLVNIEDEELAGLIDRLADLLGPRASLIGQVERRQRVARAVHYFNMTEPQRLTELERALGGYDRRLATTGLSDEVVRQRHPTLMLWTSLLAILKNGALAVLDLYGWANSLVPRWGAYLLGPLGRRSRNSLRPSESSDPALLTQEALWGSYGGWLGAAMAFPLQTYLVFRFASSTLGISAGVGLGALYALSLIPSWRLYMRRRDVRHQHLANAAASLRFLVNAGPAIRLQNQRAKLVGQIRSLLAADDAAAPRSPKS